MHDEMGYSNVILDFKLLCEGGVVRMPVESVLDMRRCLYTSLIPCCKY